MSKSLSTISKGTLLRLLTAIGVTAILLLSMCVPAWAEGGLTMHTDYPGMTAKAGDQLSYTIDFDNSGAACDASLSVVSMPEGWEGYISGSGNQISKIHIPNGTNAASATFQLTIPADAVDGSYDVVLQASVNETVYDTLTLTLDVSQLEIGQGDFASEYPEQEGATGTSFSFNATLVNNSASAQSYSLSAEAPDGWQVAFTPSGESTQVASIDIEPATSQGLTIRVTPPSNVAAGEYTIPCSAISANDTLNMDLSVTITGTYAMELSTPDGRLSFDAHANEESDLTLSVTNNSNVDLENINLTSAAPTGWTVSFDTPTIEVLEAGATTEVTAHVTPSSEALTGDYVVTISADASEVSDSAEFRVSVETKTIWGVAAVLVILILLAGIGYVFRKYGRR
ncbi:MAG TPA: hypothetical protein H9740_00685 [Candidatus Hungatella pullicola]|nr:hypothetical protein [Candidatus Hungatella pullicola]